ncbi:hypothetical protein AMTRI_Chr04g183910 [Amborella trichopoda]
MVQTICHCIFNVHSILGILTPFNCAATEFFHWLSRLKNLQTLDLSLNSFEGAMPVEIGLLFSLQMLHLSSNQLGSLPSSLANLSQLEELHLSYNQFNGTTPPILGILSSLEALYLRGNEFQGRVPHSFGNLSSLHELFIDQNRLSGRISRELVILSSIFSLSTLANLSMLQNVDLSHNSRLVILSAVLPFRLTKLQLSYCDLSKFNTSVLGLVSPQPTLETVDISNSKIRGEIPKNFFTDLPRLKELNMCCNSLIGNNLWYLTLANNNLEGPLISENFDLPLLTSIHLIHNSFNETIPKSLLAKSVIPEVIEKLDQLKVLILRRNDFEGDIPYSLCQLQRLAILDLSQNKFRGFFSISNASFFSSGDDQFEVMNFNKGHTYEYPGDVLVSLTGIDLSSNQLRGCIPRKMGFLKGLVILNLSNNHLTRTLPTSLGDLSRLHFLGLLSVTDNDIWKGVSPVRVNYQHLEKAHIEETRSFMDFKGMDALIFYQLCLKEVVMKKWKMIHGDKPIFYACTAIGVIVGFWGVNISLFLKKKWRIVYFGRIDKVLHQISSIY